MRIMTSPVKTHETMDLARLLQEEDTAYEKKEVADKERDNVNRDIDPSKFTNLVVTKDSSTELIPTQTAIVEDKPAFMLRDLNAGKGLVDDDGKPVVGKVFSRVIQISGTESKPKQLKARRQRKEDCCTAQCCKKESRDKEPGRPQSSGTNGHSANNFCPTCNRQFSCETLKNHVCRNSNRES